MTRWNASALSFGLAALFNACAALPATPSGVGPPASSPATSLAPSPSAAPSTPTAHASSVAVRACDAPDLEAALVSIDGGAGSFQGVVAIRNRSQAPCSLQGYFDIAVVDRSGQRLPANTQRADASGSPTAALVVLPPGTPAILPSQSRVEHAYVTLTWDDVLAPCVVASELVLTPPGGASPLSIAAAPPGGSARQMTVCSNGRLTVSAIGAGPS